MARIDIVTIPSGGFRGLARRLGEFLRIMEDRTDMFARLGDDLEGIIQRNFDKEQDPYGQKWKPAIRVGCEGGKTLTKTGRLRNSIFATADRNGLSIGTNNPYADTHQSGATITARRAKYLKFKICGRWVQKKSVTIPARPFLPSARNLPRDWMEAIDRNLDEKAKRSLSQVFR